MISRQHLEWVGKNVMALGPQRQLALLVATGLMLGAVGFLAYVTSTAPMQTLYTGLIKSDVASMGSALSETGIPFDVNAKGDAILVPVGKVSRARMLLAERGLPSGASAGYELFDKLGSLGLTSFMQEVTRKRALEGEIARTIQGMRGVIAARVHLVLEDPGSFRRRVRAPSASVVIRAGSYIDSGLATAIRHLVVAAVPGLSTTKVSVLGADGSILAAGGSGDAQTLQQQVGLESALSRDLKRKVRETLSPFLGIGNFRTSVSARLNTDKREIRETAFDPNQRVERSVRVVKETRKSDADKASKAVTVTQNLPAEKGKAGVGTKSRQRDERREELTNFEIGSKSVSTTSSGYRIERLTIAVVVNKKRVAEVLGKGATDENRKKLIEQVETLVASATGINAKRGDKVTISAVDFLPGDSEMTPVAARPLAEQVMEHLGALINAGAAVIVALLLIWFAVRPLASALSAPPPAALRDDVTETAGLAIENAGGPAARTDDDADGVISGSDAPVSSADTPGRASAAGEVNPAERLEALIADEDKAVAVLRQWLSERPAA